MNWWDKSAVKAMAAYAKNRHKHVEREGAELQRDRHARDWSARSIEAARLERLPPVHRDAAAELLGGQLEAWPLQTRTLEAWRRSRGESILLTGPTELGKSTVMVAIGLIMIKAGRDVRYVTIPRIGGVLVGKDKHHTWPELEDCDGLILDELHRLPALSHKVAAAVAGLIDHRTTWRRPILSAATVKLERLAGLIRWELCRRFLLRIPDDYTPKG